MQKNTNKNIAMGKIIIVYINLKKEIITIAAQDDLLYLYY